MYRFAMLRDVRRIRGLLLFKMLLFGIWNGSLIDETVEDMANSNLHEMRFLGLSLEDDEPDHSVLSRFRTRTDGSKSMGWVIGGNQSTNQGYDITRCEHYAETT